MSDSDSDSTEVTINFGATIKRIIAKDAM
ncbi:hypothetical protein EYZ11_001559 [Aspergillus tanneri]|uniref:Uncharacterized protein n=1 Tax=Aspergillus tanneri TaxID=1220188 RepID=A0A4S3JSZ8_9EURO|nr:hypothetical protein EYZ11_001559 [Aspergillus tanneri]